MSGTEKRSGAKFAQEIKRGDKEIDEIRAVVEFCTMVPEMKNDCIEKAREAMSK